MSDIKLKYIAEEVAKKHKELSREMIAGFSLAIMMTLLMK